MKETKKGLIATLWNALCIVIVGGFIMFTLVIGGSAMNGYCENGHYFVGSHGEFVEVSETLWHISSIWEVLFWMFVPLTLIGALLVVIIQEKIEKRKSRLE